MKPLRHFSKVVVHVGGKPAAGQHYVMPTGEKWGELEYNIISNLSMAITTVR
jgi:hypothetical protein